MLPHPKTYKYVVSDVLSFFKYKSSPQLLQLKIKRIFSEQRQQVRAPFCCRIRRMHKAFAKEYLYMLTFAYKNMNILARIMDLRIKMWITF